jgi:hypothetical protein
VSDFPVPSWPGFSSEYLSSLPFPSVSLSSLSASITSSLGFTSNSTSPVTNKRKREGSEDGEEEEHEVKRMKVDDPDSIGAQLSGVGAQLSGVARRAQEMASEMASQLSGVARRVTTSSTPDSLAFDEEASDSSENDAGKEDVGGLPELPYRLDYYVSESTINSSVAEYFVALRS